MSSEPEQLRKIFVGGLNRRTTEESLKEYFSLWGTIVDCVIMREGKNGPSRGFGFVTFDSAQAVEDCLKVKRHELDNWEIEPKRSVPKGEATSRTRKIFVGGLASTASEADVEEYFTKLCTKSGTGKVIDVDLKRDKENPNRLRGFAFVTFDSEEIVDKICSISFHQIKMKQCEVKKAESQAAMRKKEEQEMKTSGRSRERDSHSDLDTPSFGGIDCTHKKNTWKPESQPPPPILPLPPLSPHPLYNNPSLLGFSGPLPVSIMPFFGTDSYTHARRNEHVKLVHVQCNLNLTVNS